MFSSRGWHGLTPYRLFLLALWLLLAIYFITHPDPISIIALIVSLVVVAFAIFISVALHRAGDGQPIAPHEETSEADTSEIPTEGGETP